MLCEGCSFNPEKENKKILYIFISKECLDARARTKNSRCPAQRESF